jgi:hypothetical protein
MPTFSEILRSRLLSLIVALLGIVVIFILTRQPVAIFQLGLALILPLACIWFPDELGTLTGISTGLARPQITEPTPGIAVAIGGWILMLTILIAAFVLNL